MSRRENHYLDSRGIGFWMKLYPFVKLKNGADSFGGVGLMVKALASATVAEQTQCGHDRLFSLFEIYEIELAKNHCVLNLRGISGDAVALNNVGRVVG